MPEDKNNPLDFVPGDLNRLSEPTINDKLGVGASSVRSGTHQTQERNKKARESKLLTNKDEYIALVLLVQEVKSSHEPGTQPTTIVVEEGDTLKTYLKIYARVPELDSCIPLPDIFKNFDPSSTSVKTRCKSRDLALIKQHPFFIKELTGTKEEQPKNPTPGDLIKVRYNSKQHISGEFVELHKKGYGFSNIETSGENSDEQAAQNNRDKFSRSAQNVITNDRGPLVKTRKSEYEDIEKAIPIILKDAIPGPTINGKSGEKHETILMFNLSRTARLHTSYNSFKLPTETLGKNELKNSFIILVKKTAESALRVLLSALVQDIVLEINSSIRPSTKNLTVEDILEALKKEDPSRESPYLNWNRATILDSPLSAGIIDLHALINYLEGFDPNTTILTSQQTLRDRYNCPNNTTTDCRKSPSGEPIKVAPAGKSKHESGLALDFETNPPENYAWLVNNMHKYGFYRSVKSEKWHWVFNESNKEIRVFSIIDRFHPSWNGLTLPATDSIVSMPLQADDSDG